MNDPNKQTWKILGTDDFNTIKQDVKKPDALPNIIENVAIGNEQISTVKIIGN